MGRCQMGGVEGAGTDNCRCGVVERPDRHAISPQGFNEAVRFCDTIFKSVYMCRPLDVPRERRAQATGQVLAVCCAAPAAAFESQAQVFVHILTPRNIKENMHVH